MIMNDVDNNDTDNKEDIIKIIKNNIMWYLFNIYLVSLDNDYEWSLE